MGAHIQSSDPVEQLVIIKFGQICKPVKTCKAQWFPLERWVDEELYEIVISVKQDFFPEKQRIYLGISEIIISAKQDFFFFK